MKTSDIHERSAQSLASLALVVALWAPPLLPNGRRYPPVLALSLAPLRDIAELSDRRHPAFASSLWLGLGRDDRLSAAHYVK